MKLITPGTIDQLEAYYPLCNYDGQLVCDALIRGCADILRGCPETVDAHCSTPEQLSDRIAAFFLNIDEYL